jgi:tetratricopeptide (TPR) repeat protein
MTAAPARDRRQLILVALALGLTTLVVFAQVWQFDFFNVDDPDYVAENPRVLAGLSVANVQWAFSTFDTGNWHPLTWLSFMADAQLFGNRPGAFHVTNVILHVANVLLLFGVLLRLTGKLWASAMVAGLFGVHPLHVESVAWISERKDVLSTFFALLTLAAYECYARQPNLARGLGVAISFALGLLAKPMLVTLPCVLLLLDFWPLRRWSRSASPPGADSPYPPRSLAFLVSEKLPLLLLALVSSVITIVAQRHGGAVRTFDEVPLLARLANVADAYVWYALKAFCPLDLGVFYPYRIERINLGLAGVELAVLLGVTVWCVRRARNAPYMLVGWLWFLGTLVPVIGLLQVGDQARADRYTYIPLIGLFIALIWGAAVFAEKHRILPRHLAWAGAGVLGICAALSWNQVRYWKNSETMWRHTCEATTGNGPAHYYLGLILANRGAKDEALKCFTQGVRYSPRDGLLRRYLGILLSERNDLDGAENHLATALQLIPDDADTHVALGQVLRRKGQLDAAMMHYREAIRLRPDDVSAHNNLASVLLQKGDLQGGIDHLQLALAGQPDNVTIRRNLGLALLESGNAEAARACLAKGVQQDPRSVPLRCGLASALHELGAVPEAKAEFDAALGLDPNWPRAFNQVAWNLVNRAQSPRREGSMALLLAKQVCQGTGFQNPVYLHTLARSYDAVGNRRDAESTAARALDRARAEGDTTLVKAVEDTLHRIQQHSTSP